jgi:NAD(P)-dependent dehydrogenase (short-subunit alcohol dehydrogenase family)
MDGKLVAVTGASSGIGLAAARRLRAFGADILMINRNEEKTRTVVAEFEAIPGGSLDFIIADLSVLAQVRAAADRLLALERPINVLINNAGVHMTRRRLTVDALETVFAVDHMASFILTRVLLPRLARRGKGRIILVNSQGHRFSGLNLGDLDWRKRPYIGLRAYGAAKTSQILCMHEFAESLSGTGVSINAMHPGAVRAAVGLNNGPLYRAFQRVFIAPGLADPSIAGIALHYLAASSELEGASDHYFDLTAEEKPAPHSMDREFGREIFRISAAIANGRGVLHEVREGRGSRRRPRGTHRRGLPPPRGPIGRIAREELGMRRIGALLRPQGLHLRRGTEGHHRRGHRRSPPQAARPRARNRTQPGIRGHRKRDRQHRVA